MRAETLREHEAFLRTLLLRAPAAALSAEEAEARQGRLLAVALQLHSEVERLLAQRRASAWSRPKEAWRA